MPNLNESRQRYLIVIPWGLHHIGGVNQAVRDLRDQLLHDSRIEPIVLNTEYGFRKIQKKITVNGSVEYRLTVPSPCFRKQLVRNMISYLARLPTTVFQLARLLRNEQISVVNLHYPSLSTLTFILAVKTFARRTKVILTFHGSDVISIEQASALEKSLWRIVFSKTDVIITCSKALASRLSSVMTGSIKDICVVYNGVVREQLEQLAGMGQVPRELEQKRFILTVGNLDPIKGQDVLVGAFSQVVTQFPDHHLLIMGPSGNAEKQLRRQINELKLNERVHICIDASRQDVLATMDAAELLVLPSRDESFGLVLLEAGIFAVPVVATNTGGIPEIIGFDRTYGILVPPEDEQELSFAIIESLTNREESLLRANRLRDRVQSSFSLAKVHEKYMKIAND
jgi:glycosyltransferase involved in cell wall biosynthesis